MSFSVERDWKFKGLRCVTVMNKYSGCRCGYVGIPKSHPLYGVEYGQPSECLVDAWKKAKQGPIGKRGIIAIMCHDESKPPSPDVVFNVHGGITYSGDGDGKYPVKSNKLWWFGFDCNHCDDAPEIEQIEDPRLRDLLSGFPNHGIIRSASYAESECESLAEQLSSMDYEQD